MELQTLLETLAGGGYALGLSGCTADAVEVRGPVASLTAEVRAALAFHKPTLLALLTAEAAAEREAIQWADMGPAEEVEAAFGRGYRLVGPADARGRQAASGADPTPCPLPLVRRPDGA